MEIYVPDMYQESIFKINYELLKSKGVKCLLFDLDNTIMPFNQKNPSDEVVTFFKNMSNDFKIILFSNSPKCRVKRFADYLNVDYVYGAAKPSETKFLKLLEKNKLNEGEVAIIGDQLVTDIKGGNKVGIITILVNPISKYDPIWTKIGRHREKRIKRKLRKKNLFKGRFYDEKM